MMKERREEEFEEGREVEEGGDVVGVWKKVEKNKREEWRKLEKKEK